MFVHWDFGEVGLVFFVVLTKSTVYVFFNWTSNDSGLPRSLSCLDIDISGCLVFGFFYCHLTKDFTMRYRLSRQHKTKN